MNVRYLAVLGVLLLVCLAVPASVRADWYEDFNDGDPNGDPNGWDIDNPGWWFFNPMGVPVYHDIVGDYKALRLWCDMGLFPLAAYFAIVDDGILDPNTSATYWDDTTNHYILCKAFYRGDVYNPGDPNDPNNDKGQATVFFHADVDHWYALRIEWTFHNCAYRSPNEPYHWEEHHFWNQHLDLGSVNGTDGWNLQRLWIDPNGIRTPWSTDPNTSDPNDTAWLEPPERNNRILSLDTTKWLGVNLDSWERQGFWMLVQFERDPNYASGDPNGKFLRGAYWIGDKYDWDGEWMLSHDLSTTPWSGGNPADWYWAEGRTALGALTSTPETWGAGFPAEVAYDDLEARIGMFTNVSRSLALTVKNASKGTITIDPDLRDPNDPNQPDSILGRFTDGTEIVMVAQATSGNSFKQWKIFDPNHPGDSGYAVIDTNSTLYLTMDADWEIEAAFKCGSSAAPLLPMMLAALGLAVVLRRKA